jgi:hypothetical protein
MDWIVVSKCDECNEERTLEVGGNRPPYEIGDLIDQCPCGGKFVVEEILEVD